MKKLTNVSILGLMAILFFGLAVQTGYNVSNSATNLNSRGEVITEDVLLQKDRAINEVAIYEEGLNPYFATSKATTLANLRVDEIEKLRDMGYKVSITGQRDNEDLPQPVVIENKIIIVSIYSTDAELLNVVKNILK